MTRFHILLFLALLLPAVPAHAEDSPYKGGMKYTTMGNSNAAAAAQSQAAGQLHQKNMIAPSIEPTKEEEDSASKVWKKYKALAAGEAQDEPVPEPAAEEAETPPPPPKTGFAAIIDKYQQNKAQQSQLRTIEVERPKPPEKPVVEKP